jgi:hypothetical protein
VSSDPSQKLPLHLGALLPFEIEASISQKIIDHVIKFANSDGGFRTVHVTGQQQEAFWKAYRLRSFQQDVPFNGQPDHRGEFWLRHRQDLKWTWIETDITSMVKKEIEKILPLYHFINRVMVLLQNPGTTVPMHKDRVAGSVYGDEVFKPEDPDVVITKNTYHQEQGNLCIKIPLTSRPGQVGDPVVEIDGQEYRYDVGRRFFLLNEVDMLHGAMPVDFYRGVIFIDGKLKLKAVQALDLEPIPLQKRNLKKAI